MRTKAAFTLPILGLAWIVGSLFFIFPLHAEEGHHQDEHSQTLMGMAEHGQSGQMTDKARCAFDGSRMKASAMIEIKHEGQTLYFCNQKEADMFLAHPDKYLKRITVGQLTFNLNMLTADEYKEMMEGMGMGSMLKMDVMQGKTHHISVYLTQAGNDLVLDNLELALQITDASGKGTTVPLGYDKMMKTYGSYVAMPSGGKYQIGLLMMTPKVSVSL